MQSLPQQLHDRAWAAHQIRVAVRSVPPQTQTPDRFARELLCFPAAGAGRQRASFYRAVPPVRTPRRLEESSRPASLLRQRVGLRWGTSVAPCPVPSLLPDYL